MRKIAALIFIITAIGLLLWQQHEPTLLPSKQTSLPKPPQAKPKLNSNRKVQTLPPKIIRPTPERPMPSIEEDASTSQPMRLRFYTQNEDGSIPRRGAILSDDCEYRLPLSKTGEVELFLQQECEFYAVRYDGLFRLYSDPVVVPYIESGSIEQEFFFPIARTGGFGIRIGEAEEGIHVLYVYPSGPAAEQDIGVGDIIIEIDGMPAKEMTIEEFIEYGTGPEGTAVSFRLLRDLDGEQPRTIIRRSLQN